MNADRSSDLVEVRVKFDLQVDDGFPPISAESLLGFLEGDGSVRLDNTPFFVTGIALGDIVACGGDPSALRFERVINPSKNSAISILFIDNSCEEQVYQSLRAIGCYCEFGEFPEYNMLAVCVPAEVSLSEVNKAIHSEESSGLISIADLCIR